MSEQPLWWAEYTRNVFYHSTGLDDYEEDDETGRSGWYFKLRKDSKPVGPYDSLEDCNDARRDFMEWDMEQL